MFLTILSALKAIPEIVSVLNTLVGEIKTLRRESIESELNSIKKDVNETISKIQNATTNEARAALVRELNSRLSK